MPSPRFLDFDLALEKSDSGFRAHVVASPAGQADNTFVLPFPPDDLNALLAQFGRGQSERDQAAASAQTFGKHLFDAVFVGPVRDVFLKSSQSAQDRGAGLRLILRLSNAPALQDLPWELLADERGILTLSTETPIVRYLETTQPARSLGVRAPLRALVVMASPLEYVPLDLAAEWRQLDDALADVKASGVIEVERLERPTLAELQTRLRKNSYHILHFSGHGEFDETAQTASLVLQDEKGNPQLVSATQLGALLRDHPSLRLVVLNACEGARASTRDAFAGIAQALIAQGIPAVIAMQFAVSDAASRLLASAVYGAIADGLPVEGALSEARKAIFLNLSPYEWATPVLYSRATDGNIFDLASLTDEEKRTLKLAAQERLAGDALAQESFSSALAFAQAMLKLDPANAAARTLRDDAERGRTLALLYAEGKKHFDAGEWREALDYLRQIQSIQPIYKDVAVLATIAARNLEKQASASPAAPAATVARPPDPLDIHFRNLIEALLEGRVVPFLGQGVNRNAGEGHEKWQRGMYVPSREQLAEYLADQFGYSGEPRSDLIRVSQYISLMNGEPDLFYQLHKLFDADYAPTAVHLFLATLPALLTARVRAPRYPIIITTNYDDILERAFTAAHAEFDLVTYRGGGAHGELVHRIPDGATRVIEKPNEYTSLDNAQRTIIVKIHGAIDRKDRRGDSYIITEDHYIEYLSQSELAGLIPNKLQETLSDAVFLFLGYNLSDWNLRVLLRRLWGSQPFNHRSWAVTAESSAPENEYWRKRNAEVLQLPLESYVEKFAARLKEASGGPQ